jgi:hypothetical protein
MKNENSEFVGIKSLNDIITFEDDQELRTDRSLKTSKIRNDKESKNNNSLILNDKSEIKIYSPEMPIQQRDNKKLESNNTNTNNTKLKKISADNFENFVNESGICSSFELIFSEIIYKKIPVDDHFSYAAGRLRQIGREIETIKNQMINK